MVSKFTMKMTKLLVDELIGNGEDEFNLRIDSEGLAVFNRGKVVDVYKYGDKPISAKKQDLRVNLNAFKNSSGKVVKYQLEEYLYTTINKIIAKQLWEEAKNLVRVENAHMQVKKNTKTYRKEKDSDDLEF